MKKEKFCKDYKITEDQFIGKEKIGGSLDLRRVTSLPQGFNPTVGGDLYLGSSHQYVGLTINSQISKPTKNFTWKKYGKKFALIDNIFCEILNEKTNNIGSEKMHVYSAKKIAKKDTFFIVNKNSYWAHGQDIKKAVEDLNFKIATDKIKKRAYKSGYDSDYATLSYYNRRL